MTQENYKIVQTDKEVCNVALLRLMSVFEHLTIVKDLVYGMFAC